MRVTLPARRERADAPTTRVELPLMGDRDEPLRLGFDLTAVRLSEVPCTLTRAALVVGGAETLVWERDQLQPGANLLEAALCAPPHRLPTGTLVYHRVVLALTFERTPDTPVEEASDVEEEKEVSDTEEYFHTEDGRVERGRRVRYRPRRVVRRWHAVEVPEVVLDAEENISTEAHRVPFWQRIRLQPTDTIEFVQRLASEHGLHVADGVFRVKNTLQFRSGMAGPSHVF